MCPKNANGDIVRSEKEIVARHMTKQGDSPGPGTHSDVVRQPSVTRGLEVSSPLSSKTRALHEFACRRRYVALLGISLGSLAASALIVGLVEGLQAYHDLHISGVEPLSARLAGEGYELLPSTTSSTPCNCNVEQDAHMMSRCITPSHIPLMWSTPA